MKIAVTYDNGNIFQHFGRTEYFKVYEVEDNKIIDSRVIGSDGVGHGALAGLLADQDIKVLICGGLGGGALNALRCDHHHHGEGHECGHHDEDGCCGHEDHGEDGCCGHEEHEEGGCCGSGGGCHGGQRFTMEGKNVGRNVRVHYRGTFDDGTQFDSSYDRGEPLAFVCGAGMMIKGFDRAVADMEVGQIVDVHLMPEEAYGHRDPNAVITLAIEDLPGSEDLNVGESVYLTNMMGQQFPVTVTAKDDTNITLDANHEMAGRELNFRIELVEVL